MHLCLLFLYLCQVDVSTPEHYEYALRQLDKIDDHMATLDEHVRQ